MWYKNGNLCSSQTLYLDILCISVKHSISFRDLGLVNEAEDLLSDICKFYSEDQWMQLSTKAYSLLADCQMRLKMEDKYPCSVCVGGGGGGGPHGF